MIEQASRAATTRPNQFEIDLSAIAHNTRAVRDLVGSKTWICVALKANAYGFGSLEVAQVALAAGADAIAVADPADAVGLRTANITAPILLYGGILADAAAATTVTTHKLMPTIVDEAEARRWSELAPGPIDVFMKVDVGLERLGVPPAKAASVGVLTAKLPNLTLRGVYTHLHMTNDPRPEYVSWQYARFTAVLDELRSWGVEPQWAMAASSAPLAFAKGMVLNAVDPGKLIYGIRPPGVPGRALDLRQPFRALRSRLIQVKDVATREGFAADGPFPIPTGMKIGVIPIGRRDGVHALNCGQALVRGVRVPLLGVVSLEHTRLDLSQVPDAQAGDEVTILGSQNGKAGITVDEVLVHQGTSQISLPLEVRESVPRLYFGGAVEPEKA